MKAAWRCDFTEVGFVMGSSFVDWMFSPVKEKQEHVKLVQCSYTQVENRRGGACLSGPTIGWGDSEGEPC